MRKKYFDLNSIESNIFSVKPLLTLVFYRRSKAFVLILLKKYQTIFLKNMIFLTRKGKNFDKFLFFSFCRWVKMSRVDKCKEKKRKEKKRKRRKKRV